MKMRLRTILVSSFIPLIVLAVGLVSLLSTRSSHRALLDVITALRANTADQIEEYTLGLLKGPHLVNRTNAFLLSNGYLDVSNQDALQHFFLNQVRAFENITSVYFGNTMGGLVDAGREGAGGDLYVIVTDGFVAGPFRKYATDSLGGQGELLVTVPGFDARTRSWYTDAIEAGGEVWSPPFLLYTEQDMSISLNVPVFGPSDSLLGVLSTSIFLSHLNEFLNDLEVGSTGTSFIMERSGELIALSSGDPLHAMVDPENTAVRLSVESCGIPAVNDAAAYIRENLGGPEGILETCWGEFQSDGGLQYMLAQPVRDPRGLDWIIVIVIPESDFIAPLEEAGRTILLLTLIIVGVTALMSFVIAGLLTRPITRLRRDTLALSRGTYVLPRRKSAIREFDGLTISFAEMADRLRQSVISLEDEIAERRSAEEALRRSEERLDMALKGTRAGIWDWNIQDDSVQVNRRWADILGYELEDLQPVTPATWRRLVHPDDIRQSDRQLEVHLAGETDHYESRFRMRHRDGSWRHIVDRGRVTERDQEGKPLRMVGTHVDITERTEAEQARAELEERIRSSQRLESIGRLAGGVSHDLNNLLTPILGYGEILTENLDPDDPNRSSALEIVRAGRRAQELLSQLLAFSRRQILQVRDIDLNALVLNFKSFLVSTLRENISLHLLPSDSPVWVIGDSGQLEQVLMNLVLNAQDAMADGGELTVRMYRADISSDQIPPTHCDIDPGPYGILEVSDTGSGMSQETAEQIFEPFFSTKGQLGTGLGMASVHGIILQHRGGITVESTPGEGTGITIFLPEGRPSGKEDHPVPARVDQRGSETILLVEDEAQVRTMTATVLQRLGYHVVVAASGEEAIEVLGSDPARVHLLLTDVMLTGMDGRKLYLRVRDERPGIRVLFMSGYSDSILGAEGVDGMVNFIRKPFTIHGMAAKVREVLDRC